MAEIAPFRGIHYNTAEVGDLARVVAPPYDVISPEEQARLYDSDPRNIVRVILNREGPDEEGRDNPYIRAADCLREWLQTDVLTEDSDPALYVYRQAFTNPADGQRGTRIGFFCALKLEPYSAGVVLPHEETRRKAKEDRLRLMRATHVNPEPIFGLYEDPTGFTAKALRSVMEGASPFLRAAVGDDHHEVWRLDDPQAIGALQRFMAERRVWIADGHHRYETALGYREEVQQGITETRSRRESTENSGPGIQDSRAGGEPCDLRLATCDSDPQPSTLTPQPCDYILIVLSPFDDPGIVVLPTHRLVRNVSAGRMDQLILQLERYFDVQPVPVEALSARMVVEPDRGTRRFGMVTADGAFLLSLRNLTTMDAAINDHSPAWKQLDVSILQALVLERSLGIPADSMATTPDIGYTRDRNEAIEAIRSGAWQLAFLLNLPSAEEVRQVAAAGDKMPAKSTYFYPKLWSGLILRSLEHEDERVNG